MKRKVILLLGIMVLALGLVGTPSSWATSTLQLGGGTGTDPVLISGTSFSVLQNTGGAKVVDIANLTLLFSLPGVTSAPSGISNVTSSALTVNNLGLVGILPTGGAISPCADVFSCAGLSAPNASNNLSEFNNALTNNGLPTATQFGIFRYDVVGANLGAKETITINANLPVGTFIAAWGVGGTVTYGNAFTNAGLAVGAVPEPTSLLLLGAGLAGIGIWSWRREALKG